MTTTALILWSILGTHAAWAVALSVSKQLRHAVSRWLMWGQG